MDRERDERCTVVSWQTKNVIYGNILNAAFSRMQFLKMTQTQTVNMKSKTHNRINLLFLALYNLHSSNIIVLFRKAKFEASIWQRPVIGFQIKTQPSPTETLKSTNTTSESSNYQGNNRYETGRKSLAFGSAPAMPNVIQTAFRMLKVTPQGRFSSIRQFQILEDRKVGCGSFGTVKLARHRLTCRVYAVKIIDLSQMPSQSEAKLVERQIRLHSELEHPHVIRLWDSLMEGDRIYMIMEYADGGNLFAHQNGKTCFSEAEAFKFFAQTLAGVRYLHQHNIIHRDLKPENLLLDAYSNIKICDFGWCAEDITAKRTTFCGTYEYMAPEMLFKSQYDYRVDIWALGVLLYEMLHGCAPFKGKNAGEVQEAMLRGDYHFAPHLSHQVRSLIIAILQFQADRRLSIEEIMNHPWVTDTSSHVNAILDSEGAVLPKEVEDRFAGMPPPVSSSKPAPTPKHRKNNSLNFEDGRNININLEINNYAFLGKHPRTKNNYHSQEKDKLGQFDTKDTPDCPKTAPKKNKMEPVCRTQISQMDVYRVLDKVKTSKIKGKQGFRKEQSGLRKQDSRKKLKLRRSEMQISEKDKIAVRFNTEVFDKDQWVEPRLKKSHLKHKNSGNTKSSIKLLKRD